MRKLIRIIKRWFAKVQWFAKAPPPPGKEDYTKIPTKPQRFKWVIGFYS